MARIGCNVLNCSHNDSGVCYANRISITGKKAHTSNHTCCSSFLDQSTYSNLTSNTCTNGSCDYIGCNVKTCAYNAGNVCSLNNMILLIYIQKHIVQASNANNLINFTFL